MKCPVCKQELRFDQPAKRYICPRCDFFKDEYQDEWPRHQNNVDRLLQQIKLHYPLVSFKTGLGATSSDWVDIPPDKKNEADIEVWWKVHLISIEVTGTDKVKVPPADIWILAKKLAVAQESIASGKDDIFYACYRQDFLVPVNIVARHRNQAITHKKAGSESFIPIPPGEALPGEKVFPIIGHKLNRVMGVQ